MNKRARTLWERTRSVWSWGRWLGGRRHPVVVVLGSVGIALGTALGIVLLAGIERVARVAWNVNPIWFAICLGAQALAYFGYVFALRETARVDDGPNLGFGHAMRVVAAGFGAFFAASAKGGFEVDYWALRRAGARRQEALARVLGLGALEYVILAPVALGAAMALYAGVGKHTYGAFTLPWLAVVPGFAVATWLTAPERRERLANSRGHGPVRTAFAHTVSGLTIVRRLIVQPREHGSAFLGTSLYWFGEILCLWACLRAFHADVKIPALILAFATGYVVTRRALPAGGVGIAEACLTFSLYWLGVPLAPALLAVFSYRIFNFWLALLPAAAVTRTVRRLRAEIPQAERELEAERAA
jgi:uncharacterized membrane protein YbhN (UPF0104 family)